jgi:Flp pilus assembly protein TadD
LVRSICPTNQGRLDDAVADFTAALDEKPDLKESRTNLRLALALKGDYGRAIAASSVEDPAALLNNAGFIALLRGDYATADDLLHEAAKSRAQYYALAWQNLDAERALKAKTMSTANVAR